MSRRRKGVLDEGIAQLCDRLYLDSRLREILGAVVAESGVAGPDAAAYSAALSLSLTPVLRRLAREFIAEGEQAGDRNVRRQVADLVGLTRQSLEATVLHETVGDGRLGSTIWRIQPAPDPASDDGETSDPGPDARP